MPPKVVQVGNMLQIVPISIESSEMKMHVGNVTVPPLLPPKPLEPVAAPVKTMEQLMLERRAEKEQRRLEREQRRKEKERKRKEKEKRRQLKLKLKTENMIKVNMTFITLIKLIINQISYYCSVRLCWKLEKSNRK